MAIFEDNIKNKTNEKLGIKKIVLPKANLSEIRILEEIDIIPIENLNQVVKYLNKEINISTFKCKEKSIRRNLNEKPTQLFIGKAIEKTGSDTLITLSASGPVFLFLSKYTVQYFRISI